MGKGKLKSQETSTPRKRKKSKEARSEKGEEDNSQWQGEVSKGQMVQNQSFVF